MTTAGIREAFSRLDQAHTAVLQLALLIGDGVTSTSFPNGNSDARIRRALQEMHAARYEADAALCSYMKGEAYQPRPTQSAQGVEMQARVTRNERATRRLPSDAGFVSVGGL